MNKESNLAESGENLQNIMNEIDDLEKEFNKEAKKSQKDGVSQNSSLRAIPALSGENVSFSMSFKMGERNATLNVNGEKGLQLQVDGLKFNIEKDGVKFEMDGGAEFTMPWKSKPSLLKKAV